MSRPTELAEALMRRKGRPREGAAAVVAAPMSDSEAAAAPGEVEAAGAAYSVDDAIDALRASSSAHGRSLAAVYARHASRAGGGPVPLAAYLRIFVCHPDEWLKELPAGWGYDRAAKARAAFTALLSLPCVRDGLGADGGVLDELERCFSERLKLCHISEYLGARQRRDAPHAATVPPDVQHDAPPPPHPPTGYRFPVSRLRPACIARCESSGRADLTALMHALWDGNDDELDDEGDMLEALIPQIGGGGCTYEYVFRSLLGR